MPLSWGYCFCGKREERDGGGATVLVCSPSIYHITSDEYLCVLWLLKFFLASLCLLEYILCSLQKAKLGAEQWTNAQRALISLEERNVAFMDKIVRLVDSLAIQGFCLIVPIYHLLFTVSLYIFVAKDWIPMKHCVHSFLLACHLLLKTLMLPTKTYSLPLTVSYKV